MVEPFGRQELLDEREGLEVVGRELQAQEAVDEVGCLETLAKVDDETLLVSVVAGGVVGEGEVGEDGADVGHAGGVEGAEVVAVGGGVGVGRHEGLELLQLRDQLGVDLGPGLLEAEDGGAGEA